MEEKVNSPDQKGKMGRCAASNCMMVTLPILQVALCSVVGGFRPSKCVSTPCFHVECRLCMHKLGFVYKLMNNK